MAEPTFKSVKTCKAIRISFQRQDIDHTAGLVMWLDIVGRWDEDVPNSKGTRIVDGECTSGCHEDAAVDCEESSYLFHVDEQLASRKSEVAWSLGTCWASFIVALV